LVGAWIRHEDRLASKGSAFHDIAASNEVVLEEPEFLLRAANDWKSQEADEEQCGSG
jgi:hypothetical protein